MALLVPLHKGISLPPYVWSLFLVPPHIHLSLSLYCFIRFRVDTQSQPSAPDTSHLPTTEITLALINWPPKEHTTSSTRRQRRNATVYSGRARDLNGFGADYVLHPDTDPASRDDPTSTTGHPLRDSSYAHARSTPELGLGLSRTTSRSGYTKRKPVPRILDLDLDLEDDGEDLIPTETRPSTSSYTGTATSSYGASTSMTPSTSQEGGRSSGDSSWYSRSSIDEEAQAKERAWAALTRARGRRTSKEEDGHGHVEHVEAEAL